jgi:hypothetical protein
MSDASLFFFREAAQRPPDDRARLRLVASRMAVTTRGSGSG